MKLVELQECIDNSLPLVASFVHGYFYDVGSIFGGHHNQYAMMRTGQVLTHGNLELKRSEVEGLIERYFMSSSGIDFGSLWVLPFKKSTITPHFIRTIRKDRDIEGLKLLYQDKVSMTLTTESIEVVTGTAFSIVNVSMN